jgi:hypothetical protein
MKKHIVITPKSVENMINCFAEVEELPKFLSQLMDMAEEVVFLCQVGKRVDSSEMSSIAVKQITMLALFVREHIELIQQLTNCVDAKYMTQEQINERQEG